MRYIGGQHVGRVYCDGIELVDVIECDDAEGFAIVVDRDAAGRLIADGDEVRQRRLTGQIVFKPDLPARS